MAHSRGFDLSHLADGTQERFGRQFASLASEARHLSEALARYTESARHDLGHVAHDLADQAVQKGAVAARVMGRQAWKAGKAVRNDPVPVVVALVGLACLLSLVVSSGRR
ncbi:MAG: hypothetical protein J0I99_10420 [Devosia sp.]|uniref:hypothetical protein n=1 Tax=Devosia sp. TaxID=1871048 RepID=UPI001AC4E4AD|nr:hypothetical protein [Devosia sp.]MBN9311248.1 hypothetical protein [Devosia sp.]MBN9316143.1 hypothetical protein [Devosia sp.]